MESIMNTWGGKRPGAGRPKGSKNKKPRKAKKTESIINTQNEVLAPLEYLLKVMNDPTASNTRRDKAAISAAQYMHPKGDRNSKTLKGEKAKIAGAGIYSPGKTPSKVIPLDRDSK